MLRAGVRLYHIRHGETDWNREGRLQGQRDIPINARGRQQAKRNGQRLREQLEKRAVSPTDLVWVASPLGRTRETMAIVRQTVGIEPAGFATDPRVMEVDFGAWSGHTYAELARSEEGRAAVARRKRDKWNFQPPGGETYWQLSARVGEWLSSVEQDTVLVSHGGVYRVLQGLILGIAPADVPKLPAPQDRFAVFEDATLALF